MTLREVKQRFFALRNGLLADMMRKQCADPHKLIFGLNLPQIKAIAAEAGADKALAAELWADADCRESRLLAPMLMPAEESSLALLSQLRTVEEADVACHSLLRRCPGAADTAMEALGSPEPLTRYAALRLLMNLMPQSAPIARKALESLEFHPLTDAVARQIRTELEYAGNI